MTNAQITSQRQLIGSLAVASGHFDFYGGDGQGLDQGEVTQLTPAGLRRPAFGCTVSNVRSARADNLVPGPWFFSAGIKVDGVTVGSRAIYMLFTGPDGTKWRAANTGAVGDADGTPMQVSRPVVIPEPGWRAEAFGYQNVQTRTHVNDEGGFAHFTGIHGLTVPGVPLG